MKKIIMIPVFVLSLLSLHSCGDGSEGKAGESEKGWFANLFENSETLNLDASSKAIQSSLQQDGSEISAKQKETLEKFYSRRNYAPVWNNSETLNSFFETLQKSEEEGLSFSDYHGEQIEKFIKNNKSLKGEKAASLDILLTKAFLDYSHDLYYGKLDPRKLNEHWGVKRESKNFAALLEEAINSGKVQELLDSLKPTSEVYKDLKISLSEYRNSKRPDSTYTKIEDGEMIKPGEKDGRIPAIAQRLKEIELLNSTNSFQDNQYSPELQKAVEKFQEEKGMQVDGIIGNTTIAELNIGEEQRYKQILANLERWRWYPRDLGDHYILINIPNYKLAVVKDGDTVREHNVIAGTRERQTPIFSDTIQYIVINPEWTVPPTIKSNDVIPKAKNDPSYLRKHNMKVTGPGGEEINPAQINWSGSEVESYSFTQQAGPSNPLGRLKIIYPNQYLIYLHDTPAKSLFSQNERAESSGCVRVENVVDLAGYILQNKEDWDKEKIQETIQTGKTLQVKVEQPIQVHHFYWTAWRAGGETVFTRDVYNLDEKIYSRLLED